MDDDPRRAQHDGADAPGPLATLIGEVALVDASGRAVRVGGRQPQLVLAYLLIEDRTVTREEVAELLWGERVPPHWAGAVRGVLSKVRAALQRAGHPGDALVVDGGLVRLHLGAGPVTDLGAAVAALEGLRADAERHGPSDDVVASARRIGRTLAGPFLVDADGDWVRHQQERVAGLVREAAAIEIEGLVRVGRAEQAAVTASARVADDPFDERAHHLRIEALLAAGRTSDAVAAYEHLASILRTELGIAPSDVTAALVATIRPAEASPPTPEPPATATVAPRPTRTPGGSASPLPARRPAWQAPSGPFVGRAGELALLRDAWTEVGVRGEPKVVVIRGHAGLGKTRLAAELARDVAGTGSPVLWGRCRPSSGVAFEPVVDALAGALHDRPDLVDGLGADVDGLVALFPELRRRYPDAVVPDDTSVARAQVLRSVGSTVAALAATPVLWVVDDLQWAATDTLAMLEVVLEMVTRPVLLVATYRGSSSDVDGALGRIQRVVPTSTVSLAGFDGGEVADLVEAFGSDAGTTGVRPVARLLRARTGGNPFLITEILADTHRRGLAIDADQVPGAAREWILRRVSELGADDAGVLQLAAVIGDDVDLDLLVRCRTEPLEAVLDRCERLVAAGLLVEGDALGSFAFPHPIMRGVVLDDLSRSRVAVLHRTIGDALREMPRVSGRHRTVAVHYGRAGGPFVLLAAEHQIEAGREALAQSAWDLAADLFDAAVVSIRPLPETDRRAALLASALVGLGQARHRRGERGAARAVLEDAVAVARTHHLPIELASAALLLVGRAGRGAGEGMADADQAELLRDARAALATIPADDPAAEARDALVLQVEGELALALLFTDTAEERRRLTADAVTRVRRAPVLVPANLARALLNARIAKLEFGDTAERLADLDEVLALPAAQLSPEQTIAARTYRHEELLRLGRRREATRALERARALADQHRHPYWQWAVRTWEGLGCAIDGDLDRAEELALAAPGLQTTAPEESIACLGVNLVGIRLLQGRAGEVVDLLADAADRHPEIPCYRAVLALCLSEHGDRRAAAVEYRTFADRGFAAIPHDPNRFLALTVLGHVAADLGDRAGGAILERVLAPAADLHVVLNCYGGGGTYWGPGSYVLARLAALRGRADLAVDRFATAERAAEAMGALAHLDRIRCHAGALVG